LEDKGNDANKRPYAFFIVLISVFIAIVIVWSMYANVSLTNQQVTLIMLLAILGLSFSFDKLMLGKIFSIEKKIENVKGHQEELTEENNKMQEENLKFKQEMLSFTINSLNQISTQNNNTKQQISIANVLPAPNNSEFIDKYSSELSTQSEGQEGSESLGMDTSEETQQAKLNTTNNRLELNLNTRNQYSNLLRISERWAINAIAKKQGFSLDDINYQVKISFSDDMLSKGRDVLFDAFIDSGNLHYFIEVDHIPIRRSERIYSMISDVKKYSEINKVPAKMILVLVNSPNDITKRYDLDKERERIAARFQPAIENNLIMIETYEFDFENYLTTETEVAVTNEQ
jgi:hypothetical protein